LLFKKRKNIINSDSLLILAAIIWGFGFVAQKDGANYLGPYAFNGIRFLLGAIFVFIIASIKDFGFIKKIKKKELIKGAALGFVLFLGISFQQTGLMYTTASNGGFITGLYVIMVPALGFLMWRKKTGIWSIFGSILATIGLYFLSFDSDHQTGYGDILILVSTFFWAYHVLLISKFVTKIDPVKIAFIQFVFCSLFSFIAMLFKETIDINMINNSYYSLLYTGVLSSGVAFTLQIVGQKKAHPTHASIIMSLECVFAAVGAWLILGEILSIKAIIGCTVMLSGMVVSQIKSTS
jgi:drug/metabolite transporter (DMT)-like permease